VKIVINRLKIQIKIILLFCSLLALSGCQATMDDLNKRIKDASTAFNEKMEETNASNDNNNSAAQDAAGLKQAGIFDIFVDIPYDESKKSEHQWPRVAIEVLSSPPNINEYYAGQGISGIPLGCFDMKATVWKSATDKKTSEPFKFCFDKDIAWGVPLRDYQNWASRWDLTNAFRENSGNTRTNVLPPKSFVPNNIKYKRQFSNSFLGGFYNADSVLGLMIFSVAAHAGIDPSISSDHRLWFTRVAPL
jgi:hypothetical protein